MKVTHEKHKGRIVEVKSSDHIDKIFDDVDNSQYRESRKIQRRLNTKNKAI